MHLAAYYDIETRGGEQLNSKENMKGAEEEAASSVPFQRAGHSDLTVKTSPRHSKAAVAEAAAADYVSPTSTEAHHDEKECRDESIFDFNRDFAPNTSERVSTPAAVPQFDPNGDKNDDLLIEFLSTFWKDDDDAPSGDKATTGRDQPAGQDQPRSEAAADANNVAPSNTSTCIPKDSIHICSDGHVEVASDGGCLFNLMSGKSFCADDEDNNNDERPCAANLCFNKRDADEISVLTEAIVLPDVTLDKNHIAGTSRYGTTTSIIDDDDNEDDNEEGKHQDYENPLQDLADWACGPSTTCDELTSSVEPIEEDSVLSPADLALPRTIIDNCASALFANTNAAAASCSCRPTLRAVSSSGDAMKRMAVAKKKERRIIKEQASHGEEKSLPSAAEAPELIEDTSRGDDDCRKVLPEVMPEPVEEQLQESKGDAQAPARKQSDADVKKDDSKKRPSAPVGILRKGKHQGGKKSKTIIGVASDRSREEKATPKRPTSTRSSRYYKGYASKKRKEKKTTPEKTAKVGRNKHFRWGLKRSTSTNSNSSSSSSLSSPYLVLI